MADEPNGTALVFEVPIGGDISMPVVVGIPDGDLSADTREDLYELVANYASHRFFDLDTVDFNIAKRRFKEKHPELEQYLQVLSDVFDQLEQEKNETQATICN